MKQAFIEKELAKYDMSEAKITELKADYMCLKVQSVIDEEGYQKCKAAFKEVQQLRIKIEQTRVDLKADSLEYGRLVDTEAKKWSTGVIEVEKYLLSQRKIVEDEKARIQEEKERRKKEAAEKERREEEARIEAKRKEQEEREKKLEEERNKLEEEKRKFALEQEEKEQKEKEQSERARKEKEQEEAKKLMDAQDAEMGAESKDTQDIETIRAQALEIVRSASTIEIETSSFGIKITCST